MAGKPSTLRRASRASSPAPNPPARERATPAENLNPFDFARLQFDRAADHLGDGKRAADLLARRQ